MSKQTKKAAARMGGRTTAPVSKAAQAVSAARKSSGARVYAPKAVAAEGNPRALQIVAGVLALLCLAGGIAVAVLYADSINATLVVELVALALLAGAAIFTVLKPDTVLGWGRKIR